MKQKISGIPVPGNGKFPGILSTLLHMNQKAVLEPQEIRGNAIPTPAM